MGIFINSERYINCHWMLGTRRLSFTLQKPILRYMIYILVRIVRI